MLLIALLLAAQPDAVALTQEAQVKELCAALQPRRLDPELDPAEAAEAQKAALARRDEALSHWYRLEVPAKGFNFGRYRAQEKLLELDGDFPLRAVENTLSLDLDGIDDVAFNATPSQVTAWSKAKKAGTLRLQVVFKPAGDRCAGSAAAEAWRLSGRPRSWELLGEQGVVAAADGEGEPVGGPPHAVKVEKVAVDSDAGALDDDGGARLAQAQRALDKCAAGAQRAGTVLLTFVVEGGRVRDPQVIMDSLRDEKVAGCLARAVSGAEVGGTGHGTASISLE
jgi:hypothetical protein